MSLRRLAFRSMRRPTYTEVKDLGKMLINLPDDLEQQLREWILKEYGEGRGTIKVAFRKIVKDFLKAQATE